jgi:nicotinamide riboside transporter PnuC
MVLIVLGYYLNANQMISCWPVWFAGNILMGTYCCLKETYPPAILSFAIAILNIYGYISWTT